MAFVYQQPRALDSNSKKKSILGPGKYTLNDQFETKPEHFAPFLSTCNRQNKKQKFTTPGPGAYSLDKSATKVDQFGDDQYMIKNIKTRKPKFGFLSTLNRFKIKEKVIPGPGSYQQVVRKPTSNHRSNQNKKGVQLLRNNLSKTKSLRVPTIPSRINKNGYTINNQNQLAPIKEGQQKIVPFDKSITQQFQPKVHIPINFENVTSKLIECTKQLVLRDYEKSIQKEKQIQKANINFQKPLKRRLRLQQKSSQKLEKLVTPGPGAYQQKNYKRVKKVEKFQFFGSSSLRFPEQSQELRGNNNSISIFQKTTSQKKMKFKQSFSKCQRDLFHTVTDNSPGPGNYLSTGFKYNQRKVVTSMEPRFKSEKAISETTQETNYESVSRPVVKKKIKPDFPKFSRVMKTDQCQNNIGPASYDVSMTDIATEVMKKRSNVPFGCKDQRFLNTRSDTFDVDYLPSQGCSNKVKNSNPFNASTQRFGHKKQNKENVGPGLYDSSSSLIKDSFNVKFIKVD